MSNYLLLISLKGTDPEINRLISIPSSLSFHDLHNVIQTSFGWADCHLYQFVVTEPSNGPVDRLQWRQRYLRLERDPELDEFNLDDSQTSSSFCLFEVFESEKYKGKAVEYEYDFGDGWNHSIELIGLRPGDTERKVMCFAGQGHSPAEDSGGVFGWQEIVDAYNAKKPNDEQKDLKSWYENRCTNCDPKGLSGVGGAWEWDREKVNRDLQRLRLEASTA